MVRDPSAWSVFALAAERLDVQPWPAEVRDAVEVLAAEVEHAGGCGLCAAAWEELPMVVAALTGGGYNPGWAALADAAVELADVLRVVERRCARL